MITSTRNRQIVTTVRLKKRALRDKEARFLVEGAQVTAEALDAGALVELFHTPGEARFEPIVVKAAEAGVRVTAVSEPVMGHLTSTVTPQGILGVARYVDAPLEDLPGTGLVPVLCSVRDPGNAGTILRSADAAGAEAVVFTRASVDVYNTKTVRASAGSLFHLPVVRGPSPEEAVEHLRERGMRVLAAAADGDASLYETDLSGPTVVLFGNEAWGLEADARKLADRSVRVPIIGKAESLNLAAAAALVMFEATRQRASGGGALGVEAIVSAASHDIRSPLTALTGFAATLNAKWGRFEDEQRREIVRDMLLDGERVSAVVRLVVDAVRVAAGTFRPPLERTPVRPAADWVAKLFGLSTDFPQIEVEGEGTARADRDRLNGMLLALAEGALWWASEGPVEIRIRPASDGVEAEVRRGGEGPSAEQAAAMFSAPKSGGKVSLFAAARVAEAMGGGITCEAEGGVRFLLRLPG
ncbi:MAG TPA: TrmH family RNA methyltransferase [Actinomycetota bacterium]